MNALLLRFCQGLFGGTTLVVGGCASILGVDKATCDPNFDPACAVGDSNDTDGLGDGGGQSSGPLTKEQACEEYCSDVSQACTEFPQYLNEDGCREVCSVMLPLADGDGGLLEDTLECRAAVAKKGTNFDDDPQGACETAGPMGVNCGDECEKYCDYMQRFCAEEFEEMAEDCVAECRTIPRKPAYVHTDVYNNTLECRFIHIQLSITVSPIRLTHCEHAAGKSLCVD